MSHEVIATILIGLLGVWVVLYTRRLNTFPAAASDFRSAILDELSGIYPVVGTWSQDDYARIHRSALPIKRAAHDFMTHIPFYRKYQFKRAVSEYCEQADQISFESQFAQIAHNEVCPNEAIPTPKENIVQCISHLLTFTET